MNCWYDFCVGIDHPTQAEKNWLGTQFVQIPPAKRIDEGDSDEDPEQPYGPVTALEDAMRKTEIYSHDIGYSVKTLHDGSEIIILSNTGDGSGETDVLHHLLVAFTAAFPDRSPIEMEWACNADRHAPDVYGGGATLFHKGEAHFFNTTRYLRLANERIERCNRRFDHLPLEVERYYLRYVSFTPETLVTLTTQCDGTIGE